MPLFGNVFAAQPATTAVNNAPSSARVEPAEQQLTVNNAQTAAEPEPIAMTAPAKPVRPANDEDTVAIRYEYDYYMSDFEYEQAKLGNWEPWNESCRKQKAAEPKTAPAEPAPAPKAQTKTEPTAKQEYVAPASPQEAHDRIEAAATAVPAKITKQQQGDQYIFGGKTFGLRQAFTMLGGAFDKQSQSWSISVERYDNPTLCQDTFDAEVERSKKAADATAKREADIQKRIDEAVAEALKNASPDGMITIDQAKDNTRKAINLLLQNLSKMNTASLEALVTKAYAS